MDIANKYIVAANQRGIVIMVPPRNPMTNTEALTLAAWLVALADTEDEFQSILEAVQNT